MKLAAIYNVFDGEELLKGSMECLREHVDVFIIVWQDVSNIGEEYKGNIADSIAEKCVIISHKYTPDLSIGAMRNEINKRNIGLEIAKSYGCTNFLHVDVDEYYEDFGTALMQYKQSKTAGSVCRLFTYFKYPTLRFETPDEYYVPFIHELKADTNSGWRLTPYKFYVDPTRSINTDDVVLLPDVFMHHFSWVRKDIERKARNSSAARNIKRTTLVEDFLSPDITEGSVVKDYYGKKLIRVPNTFNIEL
jgi:hypothetical protein